MGAFVDQLHVEEVERRLSALYISPEGCEKLALSETTFLDEAYQKLGCARIEGTSIGNGLYAYVDAMGTYKRRLLNVPLMRLALEFGVAAPFFGPGIIVGEGDASVTPSQYEEIRAVTDTFSSDMDEATEARLYWVLNQFPEVLPYLATDAV